jgi:hypothetical protein
MENSNLSITATKDCQKRINKSMNSSKEILFKATHGAKQAASIKYKNY